MKKYWKMILTVCVSFLFLLTACGKAEINIAKQLELGQKYLAELDYKNAVIAFKKAIDLEPKTLSAYQGLADAYMAQDDVAEALAAVEAGIQVYETMGDEEKTEELTALYESLQQTLHLLQHHAEWEQYGTELQEFAASLEQDSVAAISQERLDPAFYALAEQLVKPAVWPLEDRRYLIVYPDGSFYIGEMEDGKRSGQGIFYIVGTNHKGVFYEYFSGEWRDGYPNGQGSDMWYQDVEISEWSAITGNYQDGYEDGQMQERWLMEGETEVLRYHAAAGVPDELEATPDELYDMGDDEYVYARSEDFIAYFDPAHKLGVSGCMKQQ